MDLNNKELDKLIGVIETFRRRLATNNEDSEKIEYISTGNEIEKLKAPCCHIVEARRGCGKTTFITKALSEENNVFQIYIDCQKYININPDDIVLKICNEILEKIENFLYTDSIRQCEISYLACTKGLIGYIKKKINRIDSKIITDYNKYHGLKESVLLLKKTVLDILDKPDEQVFNIINSIDNTNTKTDLKSKHIKKKFALETNIGVEKSVNELLAKVQAASNYKRVSEDLNEEKNQHIKINKVDSSYDKIMKKSELIDNLKICFTTLFENIENIYKKRVILFLDDFYQIKLDNQPRILQYFHGIYKESKKNAFCFKAVAIPDSIKINLDGEIIFSKKDDFPTIVLNYDLSNIENLLNKLIKILISIDSNIKLSDSDIRSLFTNGTLIYLVMASGGIPRDFMSLFSNTLIHARDKGNIQINKYDLYGTISDLKKEKEDDREVDLKGFTNKAIDEAIVILENWAEKFKTNVILYPSDSFKRHEKLLKALMNLRYIHIIKEHVTPEGKNFETVGILIDMTLYATSGRLPNNFVCEYWLKDKHSNELRKARIDSFQDVFVDSLERC